MTEVITYSLRDGEKRSDEYYTDVAAFADITLAEAEGRVGSVVEAFQRYVQETGRETPRTCPEYTLELLTLGVLWRVYGGHALGLAKAPGRTLAYLVRLRQRGGPWKPGADLVRGMLGRFFLSSNGRRPTENLTPALHDLDRLLDWLSTSNTFNQVVKRLQAWRDFLEVQAPEEVVEILGATSELAAWFEEHSAAALGCYTPNVERFLAETHPAYRWRADAIFCGRQRVEYHLNMIGTEILNRAFRGKFLKTQQKVVLLPPCMKAKPEGQCQARSTPFGERCAACTPGCRVHQTTKLGEKHGFDVFVMPHELSVFSGGAVEPVEGDAVGIVGVSCPLTNASGGWETKALGIPAQGVLLDYCGCPWHWHKKGIPTDINLHQLLTTVGINKQEAVPGNRKGEADETGHSG